MREHLCMLAVGLLMVVSYAGLAYSRTWYVAKDGSGDFSVIQDAVDMAIDGDVIEIGPGRYDEYQTIYDGGGSPLSHLYVDTGEKEVTLHGSGMGVTIIGPEDPNYHEYPGPDTILIRSRARGLIVSDLTLEHSPWAMISIRDAETIHVESTEFRNGHRGIDGMWSQGGTIAQCRFENLSDDGISVLSPTFGLRVEDSIFLSVFTPVTVNWSPSNCDVINCVLDNCRLGVGFFTGGSGSVVGCTITNAQHYGIGINSSGVILVADNVIEQSGNGWGMALGYAHNTTVCGNRVSVEMGTCLFLMYPCDGMTFSNNELFRGSGYFAKTNDYWPYTPPTYYRLDQNYWGTVDPNEIAEYIIDGHDIPHVNMYVLFEPFLGGPVAVESQTWTEVKNLFRN